MIWKWREHLLVIIRWLDDFFPPPKRSEAPFDEVDEVHNEAFVKKKMIMMKMGSSKIILVDTINFQHPLSNGSLIISLKRHVRREKDNSKTIFSQFWSAQSHHCDGVHQVRKLRFVRLQVTLVSLSILNEQKETNFMELLIFKISTLCHVIRDTSFDKGKMKYVHDLIQTICLYRRDNKKIVSDT